MRKTAIQFSGGKDSLAVLYLHRDILPDCTVYFGDTGNVYPHVVEFVHETCTKLGANLKVIRPPITIGEYHARFGLPADIVPVSATFQVYGRGTAQSKTMLQGYHACCFAMLWKPLNDALISDGIEEVLRGSKAADCHRGVKDGYVENGITYRSPLWTWTDDQVFDYLREIGAELPRHYSEVNNSFDCMFCTAYLTSPGAKHRLSYTKRHYPEAWKILKSRMGAIKEALHEEREALDATLTWDED